MTRLDEIKARAEAIIPGPWRWFGNTATDQVFLGTVDRGRLIILSPATRTEEYVFDHQGVETYTLGQARERMTEWCPAHREDADEMTMGECQCDELRAFLAGDLDPEEARREFMRGRFPWLTRAVQVHADLRLAEPARHPIDADLRKRHGAGLLRSYREHARYEVLGYRTAVAWEMDQGGVMPTTGGLSDVLYREDFMSIATPEAEFIEHAAEDIPWLLEHVAHLEQALADRTREALDQSRET